MITSLFSSFEPTSGLINLPLNWISTILGFLFIPYLFWISPSRWSLLWAKINLILHNEFQNILGQNQKINTIIFISLFSIILFNNRLGLLPYVFTSSRHLAISLALSLPLWFTFIIYGWFNHTQHIFAHLVPPGTPPILIPFIVLIETIRNVIRPITLAVRLTANIIAGHLLLTLLGGVGPSLGVYIVTLLLLVQIILLLLETAVAVIQSYVFALLRTLFSRETN